MITTNQLDKAYGDRQVLRDVSVAFPPTAVTSIIGPNGAGKSTLLSILARLLSPDNGQALIDGTPVATMDTRALARRLSVLSQDNSTSTRLRVRDIVALGRYPHSRGHLSREDQQIIHEALVATSTIEFADRFIDELSGGQRQRVFLAMVIAQDTEYVLLDEPLNNLDITHTVHLMKLVGEFARKHGKTVLIVIHDINVASAFSDYLVAMKDGKVVATGSPEEVMVPEILSDLYDVPVQVTELNGNLHAYYF